jgi:hypothetical protein
MKALYLAGCRYKSEDGWGFIGVYSNEDKARNACKYVNDFYTPIKLDPDSTQEGRSFTNVRWPLLEEKKNDSI